MADKKTDLGTDQGTEKRKTEIDEVQSFGGGVIKSVEPEAEITEHLHHVSGGEIVERTDTRISPVLWLFWVFVLVVIIVGIIFFIAPGMFNPAMRGVSGRANDYGGTYMVGQPGLGNYNSLSSQEGAAVSPVLTSPTYIDMHRLPLPAGQNLDQAISAGSDVYQTYCIGCHGPNQDGNGPNSVSLDPKPRNLRDVPFMQAMSYQRIWTSVHKGVPGTAMPRWENTLNDTQIGDAIAYVFSLTAPKNPTTGEFISPSPAEIQGASMTNTAPAGAGANGSETGAEAPKPTSPNVAPVPTGTRLPAKELLKAPISGPPTHP